MRIYLTGFMGAGKTRLGKQLAQFLQFSFKDLDEIITEKEACSVNEIFNTKGEKHFRLLEQKSLRQTSTYKNTIIATGGGTPCYFDNMDWINNNGISIYLDVEPSILYNRLWSGRQKRPLIRQLEEQNLLAFIKEKIALRLPYYTQAHIQYKILEEDQASASEIISLLKY